ncbi:MAG: 16S rRNA (cytosine(1402)-N(4))-methyltransferase RsmH [Candidatus Magasanikbacteria bacterium]|jgi:16S rRNA (cytosine1402-N4)-methyltransferase|nr:16S rRNA (cytosine(1402)-N(4))-methyltransferase RsmH [Candidatus Magasanikbacteria bacterium]MBT4071873.1 16S rRNA (cytosine(1402)-N(4))-methyltransferase RsmH [Candidatus Magasanikbacteria bacterium]
MRHVPVLMAEVLEGLNIHPGDNVIDCTLGDAGHAEAVLKKNAPDGKLLGIDTDPEALLSAKQFLYSSEDRTVFARSNFVHIIDIVKNTGFGPVNGILMDFGWSTPQFEQRGRGFSFSNEDEPLDMRYSKDSDQKTAAMILAEIEKEELIDIFATYGEEKLSKDIAEAIIEKRKEEAIETVKHLVDIVLAVYRKKLRTEKEVPWVGGLHPATKVFQALRIAVNEELDVIKRVLPDALEVLAPGGRLAVISFHSLEDRLVKHFFKSQQKQIRIITKKPVIASDEESRENPRSRSAKLRVVEKI